jgi:hypothetical protein
MSLLTELPLASYQKQNLAGLIASNDYDFGVAGADQRQHHVPV